MNKAIMVVIALILGIGAFIILGRGVSYLLGQSDIDLSSSLASTGDYDGDGILDSFDECPCDAEDDDSDVEGCDENHPNGYTQLEKEQCESDRGITTPAQSGTSTPTTPTCPERACSEKYMLSSLGCSSGCYQPIPPLSIDCYYSTLNPVSCHPLECADGSCLCPASACQSTSYKIYDLECSDGTCGGYNDVDIGIVSPNCRYNSFEFCDNGCLDGECQ